MWQPSAGRKLKLIFKTSKYSVTYVHMCTNTLRHLWASNWEKVAPQNRKITPSTRCEQSRLEKGDGSSDDGNGRTETQRGRTRIEQVRVKVANPRECLRSFITSTILNRQNYHVRRWWRVSENGERIKRTERGSVEWRGQADSREGLGMRKVGRYVYYRRW